MPWRPRDHPAQVNEMIGVDVAKQDDIVLNVELLPLSFPL